MDVQIIATGSKGNAVLLDRRVLIDCGVSFSKVESFLKDIRLILISHAHS